MFFSTEISFKNLAMERVSSPIINNVWRACTVISLVSAAFLLLYLNQGNREFFRDSLKSPDGVSVSISSVHVFPISRTEYPPDEKNGTLQEPLVTEKNETLEDSPQVKNETWKGPLVAEKNETLEDSPQVKNETLKDTSETEKNETLTELSATEKNETLKDSLATEKNGTLKDPSAAEEKGTLKGPMATEKNETLTDPLVTKKNENLEDSPPQVKNNDDGMRTGDNSTKGDNNYCNVFDGRWVHDPTNSPVYNAADCPFLSDQVDCRRNGRPDFNYERWSWEGNRCEIPRMNKTDMLEKLRGKRVIIVGDSLNRNQFESLACLLYSSIHSSDSYVDVRSGDYKIFRSKSYKCSVEFFWAPFLVEMEQKGQEGTKILKLDRINPSAKKWKGADVMVFNTGHWWVHFGKLKAWDVIQYKGKMIESMEMESAFNKGMKTWSKWVDRNVDPALTTVFFRSISPEHKGQNWCFGPTEPLMDESYIEIFPRSMRAIVESRIRKMRTPVRYLNITKLTEYRIDAHPKIYTTKHGSLLTKDQRKQPAIYADCSHWCIPGVPDTWNRLVYASLVLDGFGANSTSLKPTDLSR